MDERHDAVRAAVDLDLDVVRRPTELHRELDGLRVRRRCKAEDFGVASGYGRWSR
jgi:hypothetical protein